MSRRIPRLYFLQETRHICVWLIFFGLAITGQAALSEEIPFATKNGGLSTKIASSISSGESPYQPNKNTIIFRSRNAAPIGASPSRFSRMPLLAEPKAEDNWSVNIQQQTPTVEDCASESSYQCLKSNEDRIDNEPHRDSFWVVLRKVFHF